MVSPLSITFNLADKLMSLSKVCMETVSTCLMSEKIKNIANGCFKGGTSSYLCSFGILELWQGISKKETSGKDETTLNKVTNASTAYFNFHGGLLTGCGFFSLADALHEFGVINLGTISNLVNTAANLTFLCANIIALEENVRLYHELKETDWAKTNIDEEELHWMKQSAFFGFISNVGYIIATTSLLFSGATASTIIIAVFSCFSGGIKIIYDVSIWAKEQGFL